MFQVFNNACFYYYILNSVFMFGKVFLKAYFVFEIYVWFNKDNFFKNLVLLKIMSCLNCFGILMFYF